MSKEPEKKPDTTPPADTEKTGRKVAEKITWATEQGGDFLRVIGTYQDHQKSTVAESEDAGKAAITAAFRAEYPKEGL